MAIITRTGVSFTDFFGRPVSKATQRVLWDPIMAEKAGYKHFMLKEIFEQPARIHVDVDYGSEYRYRSPIVSANTLAVVITQSGETADTLAALREAKAGGAASLAICNVVGSMATRETSGTIYTHAGPEIGRASCRERV